MGDKLSRDNNLSKGVRRSSGSYELVASAVLMGLLGFGLDIWLKLLPILTVSLGMLGFLGAGISIFFRYKEAMKTHSIERLK